MGTPRRAPQPRSHQQFGRGRHGPIAQLVERTADNREVSGSNPLRPTNPRISGAVAQLGERLVCNQEVAGSNPVSSTSPPEEARRTKPPALGRPRDLGKVERWCLRKRSVTAGRSCPRLIDNRRFHKRKRKGRRTGYGVSCSVNAVVKLLRAYGGCLGAGRR